jgi:hypothetical protein
MRQTGAASKFQAMNKNSQSFKPLLGARGVGVGAL